jgi:glycosyltransferase involved in cell wall biosynthesis
MRIAQVASLFGPVPPKTAGGTGRVVSYLTEELVRRGHDVTLFASGDSETSANLFATCPQSLKSRAGCRDQIVHHVLLAEHIFKHADEFDVIHSHIEYFPFSLARRHSTPVVTTLHWSLDFMKQDWEPILSEFSELRFISISNAQRKTFPWLNWQGTVYHGLPKDLYQPNEGGGKYLAFLARLSPEKGVKTAIEIALKAGIELRIAGDISHADFFKQIQPYFKHPLIEYVGEISQKDKNEFLGNAYALLFPVDVHEAFGLAMIEAMACGTPVIARDRGSIREVVDEGLTGFVFDEPDAAVPLIERVSQLNRQQVRLVSEERFSDTRMTADYLTIYRRLAKKRAPGGQ